MEKYIKALNNTASILDALTVSGGEITKLASGITENNDDKLTITLLKQITSITESNLNSKEIKKVEISLKNCIINYYGYAKLLDICNKEKKDIDDDTRTLQDLLGELNSLIGLRTIKEKVNDLIAYQKSKITYRKWIVFDKKYITSCIYRKSWYGENYCGKNCW